MSAKKITQQAAKWTTTGLLTTGVIISTGLLSFCGMLFIHPSLVLAWVAFGLAGFVDGEVYKQNIARGIDNLKLLGTRGTDVLIIKSLEERLKNKSTIASPNWFAKAYKNQKKYIAGFAHKKLNAEQKQDKKNAIKRLHRMQKFFVKRVLASNDKPVEDELRTLIEPIRHELSTFKRKIWFLRSSVPICLGAGAGFGFATASALSTALIGIGMTAALSATIWPLAAVACIGYAFLIYHTIADIICNDTFNKWKEKIKVWFQRKEKDTNLKFGLRVIGISLLLVLTFGVGVIATLATAGTWWMAVKNGALLLPAFAAAANHIRNVLVPVASATNFVFTIKNSLKSVKNILTIKPLEAFKKKKEAIKAFVKNETWLQLLNPFRIITKLISLPFMFIVFIGHIIAVGLIGDRTPGLNYGETIASAISGAVSDGLVDLPYVFGQEHGHDHVDDAHSMEDTKHKKHPHSLDKDTNKPKDKHHDHSHAHDHADPEHDHNHGLIADWVLKITLSPLLFLSAVYSFLVTSYPTESKGKENFKNELRKSFEIKDEEIYVSKTPKIQQDAAWIQKEIEFRFEKHQAKEKDATEKEFLEEIKKEVTNKSKNAEYISNYTESGLFGNKPSKRFARKMMAEYFPETHRLVS